MNEEDTMEQPTQRPLIRQKMDFLEREISQLSEEISHLEGRLGAILKSKVDITKGEEVEKSQRQSLANEIQERTDEIGWAKHRIEDIRKRLEI